MMVGTLGTGGSSGLFMFFSMTSVRQLILPCMFMTAVAGVIFTAIFAALLIPICVLPCADIWAFLGAGSWDDTNVNESGRDA
ncbi:hypothetical protein BD769DRAFT_1456394 [Suillus cothurnatus]|nr:hypothetical protein BD769DRAFT_1456394 [Suillus cothurnatus]